MKAVVGLGLVLGLIASQAAMAQHGWRAKYDAPETRAGKVSDFVLSMFHKIDIDAELTSMKRATLENHKLGEKVVRQFWMGVNAQGAVYTFQENYQDDWDNSRLPRTMGLHLIPFSLTMRADGAYRVQVGLLDAANINEMYRRLTGKMGHLLVDQAELLTYYFDDGVEFRNARSMGMTLVGLRPTFPLYRNSDNGAFVTAAGMGKISRVIQEIPQTGKPSLVLSDRGENFNMQDDADPKYFAEQFDYGAGLETGFGRPDQFRMKLGAMYDRGYQAGRYVEAMDHGTYDGRRDYQYVDFTLQGMKRVGRTHSKRPWDVGGEIRYSQPIHDQFVGAGGTTTDMVPFRTLFRGKIFINF